MRLQRFYPQAASSTARFSFREYKRTVLLARAGSPRLTKLQKIELALRQPGGASLSELRQLTGWQGHSVRGAISAGLKKKQGLTVEVTEVSGARRYQIGGEGPQAERLSKGERSAGLACVEHRHSLVLQP